MLKRVALLSLIGLAWTSAPASAENLHAKFGSSWDCGLLSPDAPHKNKCLECERQSMQFDRNGDSGACVPKVEVRQLVPDKPTAAPRPVEKAEQWNSIAAGIQRGNRMRVSAGYSGIHASKAEAELEALQKCQTNGVTCKVLGAWTSGCVYVTTGVRGTRVGWGSGPTVEDAMRQCRAQKVNCDTPIGGCIDD